MQANSERKRLVLLILRQYALDYVEQTDYYVSPSLTPEPEIAPTEMTKSRAVR